MSNDAIHFPGQFASPGGSLARSVFTGVSGFARSFKERIVRAVHIRRTHDLLDHLDDRMLEDIGIRRCEIPAVAIHSADHPDIPYHEYHRKQVI